ncbi:MAG TPA: Crp/Fnr family transcriptional regulator [Quisquiliibacterium sp.]|nr:Crp/Fnr family transcriptional regulator [Quisquiliibacterium sp.]
MDRTTWLRTLGRDPWFASLDPGLVELMLSLAVERKYRANEIVYSVNDVSSGMYGVLSGGVRLSQYTPSGKHILFSTFSPGAWFGVISEFDGLPRPHNAVTVEPTRLLHLSSAAFREIVSRDWRYCFDMARCVVVLFRGALDLLSELRSLPYPARVAQTLLAISDHEVAVGGADADPRVTQDDLAAMVGVTRQTISRLLTEWESRGLVARGYGRIRLLDHPGLARISAMEVYRGSAINRC